MHHDYVQTIPYAMQDLCEAFLVVLKVHISVVLLMLHLEPTWGQHSIYPSQKLLQAMFLAQEAASGQWLVNPLSIGHHTWEHR